MMADTHMYKEIPLSLNQQGLVRLLKDVPGNGFFTISPMAIRLHGPLALDALSRALQEVVRRHDSLRTSFTDIDTREPRQLVWPDVSGDLSFVDFAMLPAVQRDCAASQHLADIGKSIALDTAPLMRAGALRIGVNDHILYFWMHHLISDMMSYKLFLRELGILYSAIANDDEVKLLPLPRQHGDFVLWQQEWLGSQEYADQLRYWQSQLKELPTLQLRADYPRKQTSCFTAGVASRTIEPELVKAARQVARREGSTFFMLLLTAFSELMYSYSGQEDIAIPSTVTGRRRGEWETSIGYIAINIMLRSRLTEVSRHRELLERLRATCLDAYGHSDLPMLKVIEVTPEIELQNLTRVLFSFLAAPDDVTFGTLNAVPYECTGYTLYSKTEQVIQAGVEQKWEVFQNRETFSLVVSYQSALFKIETVENMLDDFLSIVRLMTADMTGSFRDLPKAFNRK